MVIERAFISITSVRVSFFGNETRDLASRYGGVNVVREGRPYGAKLSGFEWKLTLKNCWMPSINPVLENGLIHLLLQTDLYPQYSSTAWETPHDLYPGIYSNLAESVNVAFNRLSLLLGPFRATCGSIRENTRAVGNEGNHHKKKAHICRILGCVTKTYSRMEWRKQSLETHQSTFAWRRCFDSWIMLQCQVFIRHPTVSFWW